MGITGRCWWCRRENTERHLGAIGAEECVDVEDCQRTHEVEIQKAAKEWENDRWSGRLRDD